MATQTSKDIEFFNKFINGEYTSHNKKCMEYSPVFVFTNENTKVFFKDIKPGNTLLSVLAGGDQIFDLILKGYNQIDTFDINRFTEYATLGFKKAAIENLNYEEFLYIYSKSFLENKTTIKQLINTMNPRYQAFWENYTETLENIIKKRSEYHSKYTKEIDYSSSFIKLISSYHNIDLDKFRIEYLTSDEKYNELKEKLQNSQITFTQGNLSKLKFNKKYDSIYLSNIPQFLTNQTIIKLINHLYSNNLTDNGQIALTYSYFKSLLPPKIYEMITTEQQSFIWNFATIDKPDITLKRTNNNQ